MKARTPLVTDFTGYPQSMRAAVEELTSEIGNTHFHDISEPYKYDGKAIYVLYAHKDGNNHLIDYSAERGETTLASFPDQSLSDIIQAIRSNESEFGYRKEYIDYTLFQHYTEHDYNWSECKFIDPADDMLTIRLNIMRETFANSFHYAVGCVEDRRTYKEKPDPGKDYEEFKKGLTNTVSKALKRISPLAADVVVAYGGETFKLPITDRDHRAIHDALAKLGLFGQDYLCLNIYEVDPEGKRSYSGVSYEWKKNK